MSLQTFLVAKAIVGVLKTKNIKKAVADLAAKIDQSIDAKMRQQSENIQKAIVVNVLLPLASELMKEDQDDYQRILEEEKRRSWGSAEQPERPRPMARTNISVNRRA